MSCANHLADTLRARGFRMTPQRLAIMHVLYASPKHLSPAQVYEQVRETVPSVTETTVYRTLEFLSEHGLVRPIHLGSGHQVYEIREHDHHHLVCRKCGGTVEVENSLFESLYAQLEAASGFRLAGNHLSLFGLCPDCQNG